MESSALNDCMRILKDAKSDTEQFAALLLVTKLLKAENCTSETRKTVFEAIGFTFLSRLMKTEKVDDGCSKWTYKSIAVTILSCFCSDPDLVVRPEMLSNLSHFNQIITSVDQNTSDNTEEDLINDTYECFTSFAANTISLQTMIREQSLNALCSAVVNTNKGWQKAQQLILYTLNMSGSEMWKENEEGLEKLLKHYTHQFKTLQDEGKFGVCTTIYIILSSTEKEQVEKVQDSQWKSDLRGTIFKVLQNKLGETQRDPILKLACMCVELFGVEWTVTEDDAQRKFLLFLVHLCCIEVRISLEGAEFSQVEKKGDLLCSCYMLLELVINYMTSGPTLLLEDKQVRQLHSAMLGAFNAVIQFLDKVQLLQQKIQESHITVASVRVLGSWIAEETSALQQRVIELIPFLLKLSQKSFSQRCGNQIGQSQASSEEEEMETDGEKMEDVIKFLLPGLCHLSSEEEARKILITENAHELFSQYFSYQYSLLSQQDQIKTETQVALTTLCGVFLNLVVMDTQLATNDPVFSELLSFLITTVPSLVKDDSNLILAFNMLVLCLMLLRHHSNNLKVSDTDCSRLYSAVVTLLWCHDHTEVNLKPQITIKFRFQNIWTEVTELWFLGMQALNACIALLPSIAETILTSGWIQSILETLLQSKGHCVDEITKESYCGLIYQLALQGAAFKKIIIENGGKRLPEIYPFPTLVECLET